jgi:mono/diheme cytochrome c family protein
LKRLLLLLLPLLLFSEQENNFSKENATITQTSIIENNTSQDESFLSDIEYGKMLYVNPRGISCAKCHGKNGKGGQKIAKYYDQNKNPKLLKGVDITAYSFEDLNASLQNRYKENNHYRRHQIMPIYYLTPQEVQALYSFLHSKIKK